MSEGDLIQLENITKRFDGVTALDNVSFSIRQGEVHAVVGENGAGKSTFIKILAGVHQPDSGRIVLRGKSVTIGSALDARRQGVSIVFQELNLFPHLTAAANVFVNRELVSRHGLLDERAMIEATHRVFNAMGIQISPHAKVGKLSVGDKQLVEIARTLQQQSSIILMDEPNSALTGASLRGCSKLFADCAIKASPLSTCLIAWKRSSPLPTESLSFVTDATRVLGLLLTQPSLRSSWP